MLLVPVAAVVVTAAERRANRGLLAASLLLPGEAFADGRLDGGAVTVEALELPAIFVIGADGSEGLANAVVKDGYLVVDQVAPRFVLRSDKARATVVNNAWRTMRTQEKAR